MCQFGLDVEFYSCMWNYAFIVHPVGARMFAWTGCEELIYFNLKVIISSCHNSSSYIHVDSYPRLFQRRLYLVYLCEFLSQHRRKFLPWFSRHKLCGISSYSFLVIREPGLTVDTNNLVGTWKRAEKDTNISGLCGVHSCEQ